MKYIYLLPLVILFGCATEPAVTTANQKWLNAAQHMVTVSNDPLVSTPDPTRAKIFVKWAKENGYKVKISNEDPMNGFNPKMIFIVVSK